ncbi:MAG: Sensor protein [uncultured bacterium]|nr:MAG: Sensor protein [uncultured bacterium]
MRLRTTVTIIILITWGLMVGIIYYVSNTILLDNYLNLESKQTIHKMNQVEKTVAQLVTEVETFTKDTAVWNDTYQFMHESTNSEKFNEYVQANLQVTVFSASDVDMMLYFDIAGKPFFSRAVNEARTKETPLPDKLADYLSPSSKLVHQPTIESKVKGLISLPSGIYLVASHAILKTDYSGPSRGALMMGRLFSNAMLNRVGDITNLDLTLYQSDKIQQNKDLQNIFVDMSKSNKNEFTSINGDTVNGYILLHDIDNQPIALIKANIPRNVFLAGKETIRNFNLIFIGFGIIFVILLSYAIRILFISRLEKLNKNIINISSRKQFSHRVNEEGSDELTSVEAETNKMLGIIADYNQQQSVLLNKVSVELNKANLFSKKLTEAEALLSDVINFMPSMLIIIDKNFAITHVNSLAEKSIGKPIDEIKGKSIFELFPYLKSYEKNFIASYESNSTQFIDKIIHTDADETMNYLSAVIYPLRQYKDEHGIVVRIDDISDNVKLQESIQKNDRFASIGVLTAGIAHEINNPINFVKSTSLSVKRNIGDIVSILKKYAEIKRSDNINDKINQIEDLKKSIDINYTIDETKKLLNGISEGTHRTADIINGLKVFSRVDPDVMSKFDIHEGLDSTLILMSDAFKNRIHIIKEYGDIPKIDCLPGKLNQVFMNLLSNAIDSIPGKGEIKIKTEKKGNHVIITIKDNGTGISEENKNKIFEPFFTTKDVGKGLGLGLSITFGIIYDHKGQIEVKSQLGQGSEFIIQLPINQAVTP